MTFGFDLTDVIKAIGLIGVLAIVFAESGLLIGFFLPGDSLLFTAGILASKHLLNVNIHVLFVLIFLAAVLGDSVGYTFGRKLGPRLFRREDSVLFHKDNIKKAEEFYQKYGSKTVILARFVPMVRTFAPIVAGVGKMHYGRFLSFNLIGGLLWTAAMTYLGYFIGSRVTNIDHYVLPIIALIIFISVAPALYHILHNADTRKAALDWGKAQLAARRLKRKVNK
jgi:membrane-associated protein